MFGVAEDKGTWLVRGLAKHPEFAKEFAQKLRAEPDLDWEGPLVVPIPGSQNVLYIVHVPSSRQRPHTPRTAAPAFWKRTTGTAIHMTLEEIRGQFLDTERRRVVLRLLALELLEGMKSKRLLALPAQGIFSIERFDPEGLSQLMAEAFPIIGHDEQLMGGLLTIRKLMRRTNRAIDLMSSSAIAQPLAMKKLSEGPGVGGFLLAIEEQGRLTLAILRDRHGVDNVPDWAFQDG